MTNHWQDFIATHSFTNTLSDRQPEPATPTLIALEGLDILWVQGTEAGKFLQGQTTCDTNKLSPTQALRGANCNQKGRVVFNFIALAPDTNTVGLLMPSDIIDHARGALQKYIVFSKAEILPSEDFGYFSIAGTQAAALLNAHQWVTPTSTENLAINNNLIVYQNEGDRFLCFGPSEKIIAVWQQLAGSCHCLTERHWWLSEIRAGIGHCHKAISEKFLPQMLNMDLINAIDFKKGCYLGQEVVARMHYKGTDKRRMQHAEIMVSEPPPTGAPVYSSDHKTVGEIVQSAPIGSDSIAVLAVVTLTAVNSDDVFLDEKLTQKLRFKPLPYAITN